MNVEMENIGLEEDLTCLIRLSLSYFIVLVVQWSFSYTYRESDSVLAEWGDDLSMGRAMQLRKRI